MRRLLMFLCAGLLLSGPAQALTPVKARAIAAGETDDRVAALNAAVLSSAVSTALSSAAMRASVSTEAMARASSAVSAWADMAGRSANAVAQEWMKRMGGRTASL